MRYSPLILILILLSGSLIGQEYERYKKLKDTTLLSRFLGYEKDISVIVPFEWQRNLNKSFPVVVIFDRQNHRSHNYIINTIDYLTSNEQIPSFIILSVASDQEHRYLETLHKVSNSKGLAEENEQFLFNELLPVAEEKFLASDFRMFIGHSRYGYFTTSLLNSRAKDLDAVISLSPFFTQKNVDLTDSIKALDNTELGSTKYYRFGIGNDYPDDFEKMEDVLLDSENEFINADGYLFKEADHNATPGLTIAKSLYSVFEAWSSFQSEYFKNEQKDIESITKQHERIRNHYGKKLDFSLGILNGKGWYFYNEKEYQLAIKAWYKMMDSYPNFSEGYLYIIEAQKQIKQDISQTVKLFKSSIEDTEIFNENEKRELIKELETLMK